MNLAKALNTAAKDKEAVKYEQFKAEQRELAMKKKFEPKVRNSEKQAEKVRKLRAQQEKQLKKLRKAHFSADQHDNATRRMQEQHQRLLSGEGALV